MAVHIRSTKTHLFFTILFAAAALASCKPRSEGSRTLNEGQASAGKCAAEEKLVQDLQKELQTATVANSPGINSDAQAACSALAGAQWNATIGRCECLTDPSRFSGSAWSIRNTLKCEANIEGFKACKEVAGSKWNHEIGRCECTTDSTKFQANAFSIRNNLKCEANTDGVEACKSVAGAKWNGEIGRCECMNDPTKFQANAWSIRTHLKCTTGNNNVAHCEFGGAFNPSLGECACDNGKAYSSFRGVPCIDGDQGSTGGNTTGPSAALADDSEIGDKPGMFLARTIDEIRADLEKANQALTACKTGTSSNNSQSQSTDGCAAAGGTLDGKKTCRCGNGTPVYKLRGGNCSQHLAKQTQGCQEAKGVIIDQECVCADGVPVRKKNPAICPDQQTVATDQNTQTNTTDNSSTGAPPPPGGNTTQPAPSCQCGWDSTYRLCVVWKDRKALFPYVGPVSHNDWSCGDGSVNDLCKKQSHLKAILAGPQCR